MLTGIAAYAQYRRPPTRDRVPLALAMLNPAWALTYRQSNPTGYLILRPDQGDDAGQFDVSRDPVAEAGRFADRFIRPALAQVPPKTYSATLGPCEQWPGPDKLDWRASFELALCGIVPDRFGLDYVALSCPVGNLRAVEVEHFAGVFRAAKWVSYHAYLRPDGRDLAGELTGDYFWRPLRVWLPELRRLGITFRLLCTESGTFRRHSDMPSSALAWLDVALAAAMEHECASQPGVKYGGMLPFGFGLERNSSADPGMAVWNLDGSESLFEGGGPVVSVPSVGPGIAQVMEANGDGPITSEQYVGSEWSIALGSKGAYVYTKAGGRVVFVPPSPARADAAAIAALADSLVQVASNLKILVTSR